MLAISVLLLVGRESIAQAQVPASTFEIFGIPTSSERFFEAGRANFEQEINRLRESPRSSEDLLKTSRAAEIRQNLLRLETPPAPTGSTPESQTRQPDTSKQGESDNHLYHP